MRKIITPIALAIGVQMSAQNALNFDGVDDYISSNFQGISGSSARTVEAWIRTSANTTPPSGGQKVIMDWGVFATGQRFTLNVLNSGTRLEVSGGGVTGLVNVANGQWHHVAAVYDPAASNNVKIYVDGVLDIQSNLSTTVNSGSGSFVIGRRIDGVNNFDGDIDEVRVWNVARTQSQIAADMNSEFCTIPAGLVAYYRLNEGTAAGNNTGVTSTFEDISNATGTLNNFALSGTSSNWIAGSGITPGGPNFIQVTASACNEYMGPGGVIYDSTGVYLDTLQNVYGCDSVIETTLTVQQLDVTVTTTNTTLKANKANATYRWLDCNNNYKLVVGGTQQTFTPPNPNGSYAVQVAFGGCTDTSACYSLDGVGLFENDFQKLVIYPNPSNGSFTIDHSLNQQGIISVFTTSGKLVCKMTLDGGDKTTFDMSGEPKGIYLIELSCEGVTSVERLIIE